MKNVLFLAMTAFLTAVVAPAHPVTAQQQLTEEQIAGRQQKIIERLSRLNHEKLTGVLEQMGLERPDGFISCLCSGYGTVGAGARYHPGPMGECTSPLPCKWGNWGCNAADLSQDKDLWASCGATVMITLPPDKAGNSEQITFPALVERTLRYNRAYKPCDEADFYYDKETLYHSFNGKQALNFPRDRLIKGFIDKARQWERDTGGTVTSSAGMFDGARYALTFINASLPTGQEDKLHECARKKFEATGQRVAPDEYFHCALGLANGDINKALLMAHASLERHNKKARPVIDAYLAPMRNPGAYPDAAQVKVWNAQKQVYEMVSPASATGQDQQGVWYHLFGTAAVDLADGESMGMNALATILGDEAYDVATGLETGMDENVPGMAALTDWVASWIPGTPGMREMAVEVLRKGFPRSRQCGALADFAIAMENEFRTHKTRSVPDPAKQCVNFDGCAVGRSLYEWLRNRPSSAMPPGSYGVETIEPVIPPSVRPER